MCRGGCNDLLLLLFSMKSLLTASHTVWLPILMGINFALSKTKNLVDVVKRTTPHSPARLLKQHSLDTSVHHAANSLARSDSQEGRPCTDFLLLHRKTPRPTNMVFHRIDFLHASIVLNLQVAYLLTSSETFES